MKERNITVTLEKAREWYNSGNTTLKEVALQAFNKNELNEFDFTRIKTFEDALTALEYTEDAKECWEEMRNHQPFGWVRVINRYKNILELRDSKNGIELLEENWTYKELCERVTFADGTPFGIREC